MRRNFAKAGLSLVGPIALIILLTMPIGPLAGGLGIIQPWGGIFDSGRVANPAKEMTLSLPILDQPVDVLIDTWGVPHIYAENVKDAFRVLGYLHAKERLFQMTLQNHMAAGRLSELVGSVALSTDKYYRTIGLARAANRTYQWFLDQKQFDSEVAYALDLVNAEVAGVNAFIESMTQATTPIEFKMLGISPHKWTPHDIFLWSKMMTWGLSGGFADLERQFIWATTENDTLLQDMFPMVLPYTVPIIPEQHNLSLAKFPNAPGGFPATTNPPKQVQSKRYDEDSLSIKKLTTILDAISNVAEALGPQELVGSNNWVVHGNRTATGSPLLANDPHLGLQAPSLWYEAHLVVPGALNVAGVTLPGLPGVLLGHTDRIAWGFTNVGVDVLDIFVEKLNPDNHTQYYYGDGWKSFELLNEPIETSDQGVVDFEVRKSVHGPCIDSAIRGYENYSADGINMAMNWTGNGVTHEILSLSLLNQAKNISDYYEAIYWWDSPPQNIVYADDEGNIAMTVAGRFPLRSGYTGEFPVEALNDSVGMVSNIPYACNPRAVNPSQGYIQSCNQRSIAPTEYGFTLQGLFADGYRGRRIDALLNNDDTVTVEEMMQFQADSLDVTAQELVPIVVNDWDSAEESNSTIDAAVSWLRDWDFVMKTDSKAPTLWRYLLNALSYEVFDELRTIDSRLRLSRNPVLEYILKENWAYYLDDHATGDVETRETMIVQSLHRALNDMKEDLGSNQSNWEYGHQHIILIEHLAGLTYIGGGPHRGSGYTLNAAGGGRRTGWDARWVVQGGPSWRMVADLSDISQSYDVYPGGQSGNIFSPHWRDMFDLWYNYDSETGHYGYHQMLFYSTAQDFREDDTDDTLIESEISFLT
ncbi:MAG: penicillin acylase family protein [Candidatus Thorarchaeota archaeon]